MSINRWEDKLLYVYTMQNWAIKRNELLIYGKLDEWNSKTKNSSYCLISFYKILKHKSYSIMTESWVIAWAGQTGDSGEVWIIKGHQKTFRGDGCIHYLDWSDGWLHRCSHMKLHRIYQIVHFEFMQFILCQLYCNKIKMGASCMLMYLLCKSCPLLIREINDYNEYTSVLIPVSQKILSNSIDLRRQHVFLYSTQGDLKQSFVLQMVSNSYEIIRGSGLLSGIRLYIKFIIVTLRSDVTYEP